MSKMIRVIEYEVPMSLLDDKWYQAGVLDMMRYDSARVIGWSSETLTLRSEVFTLGRWQSFGITPKVLRDYFA